MSHLCIYEITNMISFIGKLNGRNLNKKGQRNKYKDFSKKRTRKMLKKILQGIFVMALCRGEGCQIRVTKLNKGRTSRDASASC